MKTRFVVPLILCVFMTIGSASVVFGAVPASSALFLFSDSSYESLYKLDATGAALYAAANDNNRQYAYIQAQKLQKALDDDMLRSYGTKEGWRAVAADLNRIEASLARGSSNTEWREHAARVRLALDAVIGGSGSLWLQYEVLLREDIQLIGQALKRSTADKNAAANAAGALLVGMKRHVNRMGTAATISGHGLRLEELRQRMDYSGKMIEALRKEAGTSSMTALRAALQSLEGASAGIDSIFRTDAQATAMPAIAAPRATYALQWAFFLGTMISAVLTFVGWRKYKQMPYGVKSIR